MATQVGSLTYDLTIDDRQLDKQLASADRKVGKLGDRFERVSDRMASVGSTMALAVTLPVVGIGAAALKSAANVEQLQVAFTTMLGSADKANVLLADIQKFAATTPFQLTEIQQSSKALLAFGIASENIIPTLKNIGDIAAGIGIPINDLAVIYGKARTQGRLFAEDINQLTERGVPIIAQLAKQFGVAEGEVRTLVEEGKVGFEQLEKAFTDMSGPGGQFFNLMENQSKTAAGQFSNFQDQLTQTAIAIGNQLMPIAIDFMNILKGIVDRFMSLSPEMQKAILIILAIVAVMGPLLIVTAKLITAIRGIALALTFLAAHPIILAVIAIIAVIAGLAFLIISNWDTLKQWLLNFWNWLKDAATAVWQFIVNIVKIYVGIYITIISAIVNAFIAVWNSIKSIWSGAVNWFRDLISNIGSVFNRVKDVITAPFKAAFNAIADFWNNSVGKLSFSAPSWVPGIGGKGFSMPKLPKLAKGGIAVEPAIAAIGEAGKEAVLPLSQLNRYSDLFDKIEEGARRADTMPVNGQPQVVNIHLDMKGVLARSRQDLRMIGEEIVGAVNEGLRAKGRPELGAKP